MIRTPVLPRARTIAACLAALALVPAAHAVAQPASPAARASMVINADALDQLRADPHLVILQVGSAPPFDSAHVPGARPMELSEISTPRTPTTLILELPDSPTLERWARSVGITNQSRIVVVPPTADLTSSTRVFLTLAFMGLGDRTSLLDGGLMQWRAMGKPVATGAAATLAASTGPLTVRRDSSVIAVLADVDAARRDAATSVVDARLPRFYNGDGGGYPRPGHVPTGVNIPLSEVSDNGMFKDTDALAAIFANAGVGSGDKVITYCHIGQQASLLWFVARRLGYDARVFDGSFQQWSGSDLPIVSPTP